jgi:hypothetical protein
MLHPDAVQAILEYHYLGQVPMSGLDAQFTCFTGTKVHILTAEELGQVTMSGLDALLALAAAVNELQVLDVCVCARARAWMGLGVGMCIDGYECKCIDISTLK